MSPFKPSARTTWRASRCSARRRRARRPSPSGLLASLQHVRLAVLHAGGFVHDPEPAFAEFVPDDEVVQAERPLPEQRAEDVVVHEPAQDARGDREVEPERAEDRQAGGGEQRRDLAAELRVQGASVDLISAVLDRAREPDARGDVRDRVRRGAEVVDRERRGGGEETRAATRAAVRAVREARRGGRARWR
eukprot:31154-Pelagococcus_subviridis.AAC.6